MFFANSFQTKNETAKVSKRGIIVIGGGPQTPYPGYNPPSWWLGKLSSTQTTNHPGGDTQIVSHLGGIITP